MSAANSPRASNSGGNGDGDVGDDFQAQAKPKRPQKSESDMTLDDSEGEVECEDDTQPKKKRRLGNIAAAKAAQFDTCMRALDAKWHLIDARLKEANLTLATEKKSIDKSALTNETDEDPGIVQQISLCVHARSSGVVQFGDEDPCQGWLQCCCSQDQGDSQGAG